MATVTGLTAARMLEIEAASVVDGEVVGDVLNLTRRDGTIIQAGGVRGPQGPQGPQGIPGVDGADGAPGADASSIISDPGVSTPPWFYGTGIKIHSVGADANGWPSPNVTVMTVRVALNRSFQQVVQKETGVMWIRSETDDDIWGPWFSISTRIQNLESAVADSGWINAYLENGWYNYGHIHQTCQYRKIGKKVTIRGLVRSSLTWNAHVFTLPEGFRPPAYMHFMSIGMDSPLGIRIVGVNHDNPAQAGQVHLGIPGGWTDGWHQINAEFFVD